MEEYEDVGRNALIAYDATDATTAAMEGHSEEAESLNLMIIRQLEQEMEKNELENSGILKASSGNSAKRKTRAETRHSTKERTNLTALKLITRKGADEKSQLEEWKTELLNNLTAEITKIHKVHRHAMKTQREELENQREQFQFEIDILRERIRELEIDEKKKTVQGPTQLGNRSTPKCDTPERDLSQNPGGENSTSSPMHKKLPNGQRNYAAVAAAQPSQISGQSWTKVSYGSRKNTVQKSTTTVKFEQRGRRILFPRKADSNELKSEADLMLALNEALQKAEVEAKVRFSRVRYAPSGSVSALLRENADATMLLPQRSNLLIRAAKAVDSAVVGVEILEQWQRLKVHGMPLERYLGPGKLELLRREVESSTGIPLKAIPRWLINEDRLKEQQDKSNKQGSAIVITIGNKIEAKRLIAKGLRFGGTIKKVENIGKLDLDRCV